MPDESRVGDKLLDAWLNLSSVARNSRLVSTLTYNEAHILGILLRHSNDDPPLTATDLIARTRLLKSQMNKLLTSMEARGYITRTRSQSDKRLFYLHLTSNGTEAYLAEHHRIEAFIHQLIDQIGLQRTLDITQGLTDLTFALEDILGA